MHSRVCCCLRHVVDAELDDHIANYSALSAVYFLLSNEMSTVHYPLDAVYCLFFSVMKILSCDAVSCAGGSKISAPDVHSEHATAARQATRQGLQRNEGSRVIRMCVISVFVCVISLCVQGGLSALFSPKLRTQIHGASTQ